MALIDEVMACSTIVDKTERNNCLMRIGVIAELEAINLYKIMEKSSGDESSRTVLRNVIKEEKIHVGEFMGMIKRSDPEQKESLQLGENEIPSK